MYQPTAIDSTNNGLRFAPKQLCLTYDDGPGPMSVQLAAYLHAQGIQATFFVVGSTAADHPEKLRQMRGYGHLIANHTYSHLIFSDHTVSGAAMLEEVTRTDAAIAQGGGDPAAVSYLRAPRGRWTERAAHVLSQDLLAACHHLGPIGWDINGNDWQIWGDGGSAQECADRYHDLIVPEAKSGIVLMHDSSADIPHAVANNRAYEAARLLIPRLQSAHYSFVRLDHVPGIQDLIARPWRIKIGNKDKKWLVRGQDGGLAFTAATPDAATPLQAVKKGLDVFSFAADSVYLRATPQGYVTTTATSDTPPCAFTAQRHGGAGPAAEAHTYSFRLANGRYLAYDATTGALKSDGDGATYFTVTLDS